MVKVGPAYQVRAVLMFVAILMAISLVAAASAKLAHASTQFTVNSTGDTGDADTTDNVCDSDAGTSGDQCTLKAAISALMRAISSAPAPRARACSTIALP